MEVAEISKCLELDSDGYSLLLWYSEKTCPTQKLYFEKENSGRNPFQGFRQPRFSSATNNPNASTCHLWLISVSTFPGFQEPCPQDDDKKTKENNCSNFKPYPSKKPYPKNSNFTISSGGFHFPTTAWIDIQVTLSRRKVPVAGAQARTLESPKNRIRELEIGWWLDCL